MTKTSDDWLTSFGNLILTEDIWQRVRILRSLVAATNFVLCSVVLIYAIRAGIVDAYWGTALIGYMAAQTALFYATLRSGLNLQFRDPALTIPQIIVAVTCVVWAYAILRELRGGALMLLVMMLVFGMFNLSAKEARVTAFFALALQGLVMLCMTLMHPDRYTTRAELIHFSFACTSLPTISVLSGQLSDLRERLRLRKTELAEALEKIQTLATRDELTGLYNRRYMHEALAQQAKAADGSGTVFSLAIIDLDHFKRVNDSHGHGTGDEVLGSFARLVQSQIGASDIFARWGGEEFLLVLTQCRGNQAQACLARIHESVKQLVPSASHPELRISFSAGIAERKYEEKLEAVVERADQALYEAKRMGRMRTHVSKG